ncbi:conjugal transfer protein TraL [Advenella sp. WQ 585]|uniref:Conjugal transfer protein TraL n=1 Tax=Advenella mandrilli TaxID=2800330 RepID=A0ABS1EEJ1_9BURK|nr:conjugal transfer protein TraL [Advenella mandrilli]MBK1781603.1 conjugal transfer protein TraL [Advenella mandrilli]
MKAVHFVLQGKGGVGKSYIASLLAQFINQIEFQAHCYDTDPVNTTFSKYKKLGVEVVNILTEHQSIDASKFDSLIEKIIEKDGVSVIDNGAATFIPLMQYLRENDVVGLLEESGVDVNIHVPITSGQASKDTLTGLITVLQQLNTHVIVWQNNYWGNVELDGKEFLDWKVYQDNVEQIVGVIQLENLNPDTFGKDIKQMTSEHLTFDEVMQSSNYTLMPKQRLKRVQRDVFNQLAQQTIFVRQESLGGLG